MDNRITFQVDGVVASRARAGVDGLCVRIVDKTVGDDLQLAEAVTGEDGAYRVTFTDDLLRQRGKARPDLQARVYAGERFLAASAVRYNASTRETLDVLIDDKAGAALRSEHETLTGALVSHFKGRLGDLQETADRQDITYLANKTGWDARAVALAALADQFSARTATGRLRTGIDPAFFYALFRTGLPAQEAALYQTDARTVTAIWQRAIAQGVIPAALAKALPRAAASFQRLAAQKALDGPAVAGLSSLKDLVSVSLGGDAARHRQFADLYTRHGDDWPRFWEGVRAAFGAETEKRLKLDGQLAYLTLGNAPLIRKLHAACGGNGLADTLHLVDGGYYRAGKWQEAISDAAIPPEIPGGSDAERRDRYAEVLAAQVRLSFPTAVLAEMVRSGETPLAASGLGNQVHAFLTEHQGRFEIGMQPVQQYLRQHNLQVAPAVTREITRIQRIYQITPGDTAMNALLKHGVDSAYAVVRYGRDEFVQTFKDAVGGEDAARLIHARSQQVHHAVLNIAVSYLTASNAPGIGVHSPAQIVNPAPNPHAGDVIAYSTLESLFGEMDYCACEHCRSILSPAAYLVDLLQFVDRPTVPPGKTNPQTVLLERRPDLQHLPLTCENTNTPLPYIDLVNETLEYYVTHNLSLANYKGHNTTADATPAELLANPQFVSDMAYETLAGRPAQPGDPPPLLPPTPPLPLHQPLENLRRYFTRFAVPLPAAMEALRQSDSVERANPTEYGWRDILMEELRLSRAEYTLLTDRTLTLQQLYGYPPATTQNQVLAGLANARAFARRLALSYEQVTEILKTRFVNPNARLILTDPTGAGDLCRFDTLEFRYANPDNNANRLGPFEFVRLYRFIRLWRKLGWSIEQTDQAIAALYPAEQTPDQPAEATNLTRLDAGFLTLLPRLGVLRRVMDRLKLKVKKDLQPLLACFAPIDAQGAASLYRQMFLSPALKAQDGAFADDGFGHVLGGPAKLLAHAETLRAAFQLTDEEFGAITEALGYDANTPLHLDTISAVFRRGWLARKLKLSVREFLLLTAFSGLDPFAAPDPPAPPVLRLLDLLGRLRAAALKPVQALYLLWNQDISGRSAPDEAAITGLARGLRRDFAAIEGEFALADDPDGQIARARLALVYGNEATDRFFGLLSRAVVTDVAYTHAQATLEQPILDAAPGSIAYDHLRKRLAYSAGVMPDATRDALKGLAGVTQAFKDAVDALYQKSRAFFDRYPELLAHYAAYVASAAPEAQRRSDLLAALLPDLKRRRKRQQALQAVGAAAKADVTFATAVLDAVAVCHAVGDSTRPALDDLTAMEAPGLPANAISGSWSGYLEAPENGYYNLQIEADAGATVTLALGGAPVALLHSGNLWSNSAPIELRAGTLYAFSLTVENGATLAVRWETTGRGREIIPARYLYSATLTDHLRTVYVRFLKAAALAAALRLTAAETAYLAAHADYQIGGEGWFNRLPVTGSPDQATATALLQVGLALLDFARIKAELAPGDEERLLTILKDPAGATEAADSLLFTLARWDASSLNALLARFGKATADLAHLATFRQVYAAYAWVKKLGVPASALIKAATNEPGATTVRDLQAALRARYDENDWLNVLQPINDEMRALQRNALVAYILHQMRSAPATAHIDTPEKLFEYFLMDVQMEPCTQTSRIRHALSSVQLFIERCLMNLEPRVAASSLNAKHWAWMSRYRVWEANRKVFLYPENWLEPELRDDQSPFFKETMSELLQSDITEDRAAAALLNYLSKLEEVAKLEPCGIHFVENDPSKAEDDIAHVVARTAGGRRKYFYRRREYGYWTPWEQIQLDIEDNPVIPVVWQDRLFLFWLRIMQEAPVQKPQLPSDNLADTKASDLANATDARVTVRAILCWSEYYNGKWQPAKTSDVRNPATLKQFDLSGSGAFDRSALRLSALTVEDRLQVQISGQGSTHFTLYNTHSLPVPKGGPKAPQIFVRLGPSRHLDTESNTLTITYNRGTLKYLPSADDTLTRPILENQIGDRTIEPRHPLSSPWDAPFFYEDSRHVFYVTTAEHSVSIKASTAYGPSRTPKRPDRAIPPLVQKELAYRPPRPTPDDLYGSNVKGPGFGTTDPSPLARFVSEDAYISRGIATVGTVRYGTQEIGAAGRVIDVQKR